MFRCICFITFTLSFSCAYKILLVFPIPGKSHAILGEGFVRNLLRAGHEVTHITPYIVKNSSERLRQIDVSPTNIQFALETHFDDKISRLDPRPLDKFLVMVFSSIEDLFNFEKLLNGEIHFGDSIQPFIYANNVANNTLWNPDVRRLVMDTKEQFDVVIAEWLYSELYCGFAAVFDCPLIWSSSMEPHELVLALIDEMPNPAYTATLKTDAEAPFTFLQRFIGLWNIVYTVYLKWRILEYENKAYQEAYGPAVAVRGRQLPSYQDLKYNASLMLGNSHASTGHPVRLPPNYIPIAGYHIEDVEPLLLPEDIQTIMDGAQHGVIYFSMGTNLKSSTMPDVLKKGFLKLFGGLKQTVIWKFEEDLPEMPTNVHILKWAPQGSILAHPNCILFITHGGLLSTLEAVKYGIPIIGMPMFADQFINIDRAIKKGFAKKVTFSYDTPSHLESAIREIIEDKRYREKVKELSFVYHDRPVGPGAELVHWVEHVVRTRGAPHLRSLAIDVPAYQKYYLDLVALTIAFYYILKIVLKRIFRKKKTTENKQKMN